MGDSPAKEDLVLSAPPDKLELDSHDEDGADQEDLTGSPRRGKKKRDSSTLRKAPQAPKRFKSSYICFFMAKQPEIKEELGDKATVTEISKKSAEMWRNLPADERIYWDEVAAKDKQRYLVEKASYTGPWQVPWKRAKKDPSAPKRPMSAFLYFSQGRRKKIKDENPDMKNTEVSRLLGEMWRNATEEERKPHVDKEREEREKYKVAIAEWRTEYEKKQEEKKKQEAAQQAQQAQWAQQHQMYPPPEGMDPSPPGQPIPYQQRHPYPGPPPPPGAHFGHYPPGPPPHFYAGFPPPPGPYQFPMNGKHPVILGPNGMPHYPPVAPPSNSPPQNYAQPSQHPSAPAFGDGQVPPANPPNFEYLPSEQIPEPQTAE